MTLARFTCWFFGLLAWMAGLAAVVIGPDGITIPLFVANTCLFGLNCYFSRDLFDS